MEPFSPNDPIHTLLGRAKPVEPRPNFTQNVLRAVRQTPQSLGVWERVQAWFEGLTGARMALAGAAGALVVTALTVMALQKPASQTPVVAQKSQQPVTQQSSIQPALHEVSAAMILAATAEATPAAAERDGMDPMGLLLVREDTSALSDSELALLVY